jgi:hypothetical protein
MKVLGELMTGALIGILTPGYPSARWWLLVVLGNCVSLAFWELLGDTGRSR